MSMSNAAASIKILSDLHGQFKDLFADEALQFVLRMHRKFSSEWEIVRKRRAKWKATIDKGALVDFLQDDRSTAIRNGTWKVDYNAIPEQMRDRAVELVTPAVPKMVVNAATSHHSGFPRPSAVLFDLEDAGHYSAFYLANAISGTFLLFLFTPIIIYWHFVLRIYSIESDSIYILQSLIVATPF